MKSPHNQQKQSTLSIAAPSDLIGSFWFWAVSLTLARVILLVLSPADLGPDEAQYWVWSRELEFGYFSKPPLIAWTIALTTGIFGNEEWAVRLAAPWLHFGTASLLYLTAKSQFGDKAAFWTGIGWIVLPGVMLSSFVITTDAPLLFFWSAGLFLLFRITNQKSFQLAPYALLGAAIGFGFLAKYAMLYFIGALVAGAIFLNPMRRAFFTRGGLLTAVFALAIISPNILWNAANDFQTVGHTADNANWNAASFQPKKLFDFLIAQPGVAGLAPFFALLWIAFQRKSWAIKKEGDDWRITALLIFSLLPLIIVSTQAFISRAHANWAAAAYPAALLLTTAWLTQRRLGWVIKANTALNSFLILIFFTLMLNFSLIDKAGFANATKEIRGWKAQSDAIMANSEGYETIVVDDRNLMGVMLYYERENPIEIVTIDVNLNIENHFEAFNAFDPARHDHVLFVSSRTDDAHINHRFSDIKPLEPMTVNIGDVERTYGLFDISGYFGPGAK